MTRQEIAELWIYRATQGAYKPEEAAEGLIKQLDQPHQHNFKKLFCECCSYCECGYGSGGSHTGKAQI